MKVKICLAQVSSQKGDIARNIERHIAMLRTLEPGAVDLVCFPELSLSNYDPDVAGEVALKPTDRRLTVFQEFADRMSIAVAVGAPLRTAANPAIAVLVFVPRQQVVVVGKRHLHDDELPHFAAADGNVSVIDFGRRVGFAICHELTVAEHADALVAAGANVYLASVAKTASGVGKARTMLAAIARRHGIPALMVNSVGTCEGQAAGGNSMIFDSNGNLVASLGTDEGMLLYECT